ncbi:MAG: DUF4263 domain-containing protein [Gemmatimonas sp.]|nr:DUF4263 domain-containing protein [Gemmatimonas sp.]
MAPKREGKTAKSGRSGKTGKTSKSRQAQKTGEAKGRAADPWPTRRLDLWKDERRWLPVLFGTDETVKELSNERAKKAKGESHGTEWTFIASAREIIFDVEGEDGQFSLHYVLIGLDSETMEFVATAAIQGLHFDANDVKRNLAFALTEGVPVYPNTPEVAPALVSLQKDLMATGFSSSSDEGKRYTLTRYAADAAQPEKALEELAKEQPLSFAEAELVRGSLVRQLAEHSAATRALAGLRSAINELHDLLEREVREEELQKCLTRNPALFGAEYRAVEPKHRLGGEYEMDYALIRISGLVDVVEIERSSHKLFRQSGDPTSALIHAEQQVLDWLSWCDHNSAYAREGLPLIQRPIGFVVIGHTSDLSEDDRKRLIRRNLTFEGHLQVLTYDDLLERAQRLVEVLVGNGDS